MMKLLRLKIGDIILMLIISITAIWLFLLPLSSDEPKLAEIITEEAEDKLIIFLNKDTNYKIASKDIILTVCVEDGKIYVSESTCKDGICHKTPPISHAGQTIVCAPAGMVIRILGEEAIVDGVSQ